MRPLFLMRLSGASKALLILGALVGAAAGLALAFGLSLDHLPPWMITVGMYKLAFVAAAGLFVAGAMLGRAARKETTSSGMLQEGGGSRQALGPAEWHATDHASRDAERANRNKRDK